jgi:transposase
MALRQVYEAVSQSQSDEVATEGLRRWVSWARRSRLEPFKRLAKTLTQHWDGVLAGMLKARTNAFVEAMNGLLQQAKRAARGFKTTENFIAIAYLRMSKLQHLPKTPFELAKPRDLGIIRHHL